MHRASGILMHISSLPSDYGIGTLGARAYEFVDFLRSACQTYWQVLPIGQTGFGDSPYQCYSAFAGNPYFIDFDFLANDGLLEKSDFDTLFWGEDSQSVDYDAVGKNRFKVLRIAFSNAKNKLGDELSAFKRENASWLYDYGLYMALKNHFGDMPWTLWDDRGARMREKESLLRYGSLLKDDVDFYVFLQYEFFKQWNDLKAYANANGISIIGDIPIYVPLDCADVWSSPNEFDLDDNLLPRFVAGVPPDYFSKTGQLWGNPLYNWDRMQETGYEWWRKRLESQAALFDVLRIDHFRGLSTYWRIPYGNETAQNGEWCFGPGEDFINMMHESFGTLSIIAEDLGCLSEDVHILRKKSGYPGMKILQFAFDNSESSSYLPHRHEVNSICYTGTHDNDTLAGWLDKLEKTELDFLVEYAGLSEKEGYINGVIRIGMCSSAMLFIAQMQDYLGLGSSARMNTPGTLGAWRFRMAKDALCTPLAKKIARFTRIYGR